MSTQTIESELTQAHPELRPAQALVLSRPRSDRPQRTVAQSDGRRRTPARRRRVVRRALLMADLVGLGVAGVLLSGVPFHGALAQRATLGWDVVACAAGLILLAFAISGLYGRDEASIDHTTVDDLPRLGACVTIGAWLTFAGGTFLEAAIDGTGLIAYWLVALVLLVLARGVGRAVARRNRAYVQDVVILGAGVVGSMVAEKLSNHPEYGLRLAGFVDSDPLAGAPRHSSIPILGTLEDLSDIVLERGISRVVVAFSLDDHAATVSVLRAMKDLDVQVDIVPRLFEAVGPHFTLQNLEGLPVIGLPPILPSRSRLRVKRLFDIAGASIGLVALAPVLLVITLLVALQGGPVLYRGERIGRGGRRVQLSKFRTMRPDAERVFAELMSDDRIRREFERTHKLAQDPRVTRTGAFLRQTSLDELPQLFDVLFGRLSLVGPRPLTVLEWEHRYGPDTPPDATPETGYWAIDHLRPGLTGYWQINGRSKITFTERIRLDMAYLSNWSLKLDAVILAKTARALLAKGSAY